MTLAERRARLFDERCPYSCEIPDIEERVDLGQDCWSVWVEDCFYVMFTDSTHEAGYMEGESYQLDSMDWGTLSYTASFLTTMADTLRAVLEQLPNEEMEE